MPYKNPEQQTDYQNKWMKDRRKKWLKENGPCKECGSSRTLQVHHVDPAKKVDHRIWSWAPERRERELRGCEVLCKKCHEHLHTKEKVCPPAHGTISRYKSPNYACRCASCREAVRKYQEEWRRKRRDSMVQK